MRYVVDSAGTRFDHGLGLGQYATAPTPGVPQVPVAVVVPVGPVAVSAPCPSPGKCRLDEKYEFPNGGCVRCAHVGYVAGILNRIEVAIYGLFAGRD